MALAASFAPGLADRRRSNSPDTSASASLSDSSASQSGSSASQSGSSASQSGSSASQSGSSASSRSQVTYGTPDKDNKPDGGTYFGVPGDPNDDGTDPNDALKSLVEEDDSIVSPEELSESSSGKKKRGRPKGSKKSKKSEKEGSSDESNNSASLAGAIVGAVAAIMALLGVIAYRRRRTAPLQDKHDTKYEAPVATNPGLKFEADLMYADLVPPSSTTEEVVYDQGNASTDADEAGYEAAQAVQDYSTLSRITLDSTDGYLMMEETDVDGTEQSEYSMAAGSAYPNVPVNGQTEDLYSEPYLTTGKDTYNPQLSQQPMYDQAQDNVGKQSATYNTADPSLVVPEPAYDCVDECAAMSQPAYDMAAEVVTQPEPAYEMSTPLQPQADSIYYDNASGIPTVQEVPYNMASSGSKHTIV